MSTPALPTIPKPTPQADLLRLDGKCAVVTGGTRGLGEATVRRLAQAHVGSRNRGEANVVGTRHSPRKRLHNIQGLRMILTAPSCFFWKMS
jgi:NAD(P)-dependent dehydrogenase (short-subunit alcohol dehydrogenase family)